MARWVCLYLSPRHVSSSSYVPPFLPALSLRRSLTLPSLFLSVQSWFTGCIVSGGVYYLANLISPAPGSFQVRRDPRSRPIWHVQILRLRSRRPSSLGARSTSPTSPTRLSTVARGPLRLERTTRKSSALPRETRKTRRTSSPSERSPTRPAARAFGCSLHLIPLSLPACWCYSVPASVVLDYVLDAVSYLTTSLLSPPRRCRRDTLTRALVHRKRSYNP